METQVTRETQRAKGDTKELQGLQELPLGEDFVQHEQQESVQGHKGHNHNHISNHGVPLYKVCHTKSPNGVTRQTSTPEMTQGTHLTTGQVSFSMHQ
jgi:hypothetical protein